MKKCIEVLGNNIMVKQELAEGIDKKGQDYVTKSGIIMPQQSKDTGQLDGCCGTVLAVGSFVEKFKKGDFVRWARLNGVIVTLEGKEFILLTEDELTINERMVSDNHKLKESEFIIDDLEN